MEVSQLTLQSVIQPGWSNNDRHTTETTSPMLINKPPSVSSSSEPHSKSSSFDMPTDSSSHALDEPVEKNENRPPKDSVKIVQEWAYSSNKRPINQQPSSGPSDNVKTSITYFDASSMIESTANVIPPNSYSHQNVHHDISTHNKNSPIKTFVSDLATNNALDPRSMTILPVSDEVHQHTQKYSSFHHVNTKSNDVPRSKPEFPDNTPPPNQVEIVGVHRTNQENETSDQAPDVSVHRAVVCTPNSVDPNSVRIANVQCTSKNEPFVHCTTVTTMSCDELWPRDQSCQTYNPSFHHSTTPASRQRMNTVLAASFHRADEETVEEFCSVDSKKPTDYDVYTSSVPLRVLCGSPGDILSPEMLPFGCKQRSQSQMPGPNSEFIPEPSMEYFGRPELARFAQTERLMEVYNTAEASVYQNRLFNSGHNHEPSLIPTQLFTAPSVPPTNLYVADSSYAKTGIDGLSCPNNISSPWDTSLGSISFRPHTNQPTDLNTARRRNATRESTATLKAWLQEHIKNPYPTKGEKIMLAIITKMTLTQVSTWFANARRRLKKENKMTWTPKHRGEDLNEDGEAGSEEEFSTLEEESSVVPADATKQEQACCKTKLVSFCPSSDHDIESSDGVLSTLQPDHEMLQCRAECETLNLKHKRLFQNEMNLSCPEFEGRQGESTRNHKLCTSRLTSEPFESHTAKVRLVETDSTQSDEETTETSVYRMKQEKYSKPNSMDSIQGTSRIHTPEPMYCAKPVVSDNPVIRSNLRVGGRSQFPCLSPRFLNSWPDSLDVPSQPLCHEQNPAPLWTPFICDTANSFSYPQRPPELSHIPLLHNPEPWQDERLAEPESLATMPIHPLDDFKYGQKDAVYNVPSSVCHKLCTAPISLLNLASFSHTNSIKSTSIEIQNHVNHSEETRQQHKFSLFFAENGPNKFETTAASSPSPPIIRRAESSAKSSDHSENGEEGRGASTTSTSRMSNGTRALCEWPNNSREVASADTYRDCLHQFVSRPNQNIAVLHSPEVDIACPTTSKIHMTHALSTYGNSWNDNLTNDSSDPNYPQRSYLPPNPSNFSALRPILSIDSQFSLPS